jgi:hypothetical protein
MNRYHLLFAPLVFALAGCVDTIDTLTREYRNQNNEAIDALMMVSDDASAARMTHRVFKPMAARYKNIDEKVNILKVNRVKKELVKEVYESDGFQIYLTEIDMNKMRLSMEMARIRDVMNQYGKEERARLDDEGKFNEEVNYKEICPNIHALLTGSELESLKQNLTQPKLLDLVREFPQWKVDIYPVLYSKFLERRKTTFTPADEPLFIW